MHHLHTYLIFCRFQANILEKRKLSHVKENIQIKWLTWSSISTIFFVVFLLKFNFTDLDLGVFAPSSDTSSVTTFLGTGLRLTPQGVLVAGPELAMVRTVRLVTVFEVAPDKRLDPLPELMLAKTHNWKWGEVQKSSHKNLYGSQNF